MGQTQAASSIWKVFLQRLFSPRDRTETPESPSESSSALLFVCSSLEALLLVSFRYLSIAVAQNKCGIFPPNKVLVNEELTKL